MQRTFAQLVARRTGIGREVCEDPLDGGIDVDYKRRW
jgi:hypothetical protein